jgi:hypothetical protein
MVFLRNALDAPVSPTLAVSWHSAAANGQFAKTIDPLGPFETRAIDLSTFQQAGFIAADAIWSTVSLSYSGRDHDIVAVEASYDRRESGSSKPETRNPKPSSTRSRPGLDAAVAKRFLKPVVETSFDLGVLGVSAATQVFLET